MDHGKKAESDVARLCGDLFLKDFVLAAPKFRTPGGKLHEVADALLPHGDVLIAMQVKTRVIQGTSLKDNGPELSRIWRRVEAAAEQVKTVQRAIDSQSLAEGETLRGVRIPLANRRYSRILGIVVFDVFSADGTSVVEQLEISKRFVEVRGIPVHIFPISDFRTIATEQDTLPDLINYLNVREKLLGGDIHVDMVAELDLFGAFKTRYPVVERCLSGAATLFVVEPGLWEKVHRNLPEMWAQRDQRIMPSYLVDKTIEEVHKCIGHNPIAPFRSDDAPEPGVLNRPTTPGEYWEIMQRLGYLSRIERAQFGAKMYEKAEAADKKPFAFAMIYRPPNIGPIVYLCSNEPRRERLRRLRALMERTCAYMETSAVVGIATESLSSEFRSHDFCLMENVSFIDPPEAKRAAQQFFNAPQLTSLDEWGKDYADTVKHDAK